MSLLLNAFALVGWRGALTAAVAASLVAPAAYQAGRFVEGAATKEAIARALAEHTIDRMEAENEQLDAVAQARRRTDRDGGRGGDGRLPDDGFRRD